MKRCCSWRKAAERNAGHRGTGMAYGAGQILAPVPWMLEAAIILQAALHEYVEAAVIAGLLVFNACARVSSRKDARKLPLPR